MTRPWGSCGTLRAVAACGAPLLCAGQQPKGGSGVGGRSFPLRCSRPLGPRPWAAHGRQRLRAPACPSRRWSTCSGSPRMRARAACPCAAELFASRLARGRRLPLRCWSVSAGVSPVEKGVGPRTWPTTTTRIADPGRGAACQGTRAPWPRGSGTTCVRSLSGR